HPPLAPGTLTRAGRNGRHMAGYRGERRDYHGRLDSTDPHRGRGLAESKVGFDVLKPEARHDFVGDLRLSQAEPGSFLSGVIDHVLHARLQFWRDRERRVV